jgi:LysM repeat protein
MVATDAELSFNYPDRQLIYFPVRHTLSIEQVASFFQLTPGEVTVWNQLDPYAQLQKGMAVRLYVAKDFDLSTALTADPSQVELVSPMTEEAELAFEYAQRRDERRIKQVKHLVRSGQSLRSIAKKYGVSVSDIRAENKLRRSSSIYAGLLLKIPVSNTPKPRGAAARALTKGAGGRHKVKRGDSLWTISKKYGVSMERLRAANGLRGRVRLRLGQKLVIPSKRSSRRRSRRKRRR